MRYNMDRMILEAHKIEEATNDPEVALLNQRGEWGHRGLVRIMTTQSP